MVLRKDDLLTKISDQLAHLELSIKNRSLLHLYDQNLIAEDFFASFLNILFDYKLVVLENISKNTPGIDLGDFQRKLSFQVSSTGSSAKVQKSIDKLLASQNSQQFNSLRILVLGDKQKSYKKVKVRELLNFDPEKDIFNIQDLIKMLRAIDTLKLQALSDLIDNEFKFPVVTQENAIYRQTDEEALLIYRSFFDRPALQDRFECEGDLSNFESALTDLVEILNTGCVKTKLTVKPRGKFSDRDLALALEDIYHHVRDLRSLYNRHVKSGEIDPLNNATCFRNYQTVQSFDNLKQTIIDTINEQLKKAHIHPIRGVS